MTAENDLRIEAVAKLLFTSPIYQHNVGDWETDRSDYYYDRRMCLMAAEDVLRGIDEAAEWEYGVHVRGDYIDGMVFDDLDAANEQSYEYNHGAISRRKAPGPWEPLP